MSLLKVYLAKKAAATGAKITKLEDVISEPQPEAQPKQCPPVEPKPIERELEKNLSLLLARTGLPIVAPGLDGDSDSNAIAMSSAGKARDASTAKTDVLVAVSHAVSKSDEDACPGVPLAGFVNGIKVFRVVSKTEKALAAVETRTAIGTRFLTEPVVDCSRPALAMFDSDLPCTRRFRNEYFHVKESLIAGFGAFASKDLRYGQHILVEAPLVITTQLELYRDVADLNSAAMEAYFSLHPYSRTPRADKISAIFDANSFWIDPQHNGVFGVAANFNHACKSKRNIQYVYDSERKVIVLTVIENVPAGTELLLSYGGDPAALYERYGFVCGCGGCSREKVLMDIAARMNCRYW